MAKVLKQAKLVLEDGAEFSGWSFGKARSQAGEVVFSTGMTGSSHALTDPASRGQIIVSTYPLAGNTGVALGKNGEMVLDEAGLPLHFESPRIHAAGLAVAELCEEPSHYLSSATLSSWMEKNSVPGIFGIDTRALTIRLREQGVMRGKILVEGSKDVTFDSGTLNNPVEDVSLREPAALEPDGTARAKKDRLSVVLVDCGAKAGLMRAFLARNIAVIRVPWNHDPGGMECDGIIVSGGPGDPKACGKTIAMVRRAFSLGKPIFGTGLGCQIMALAAGADTYKLPCGHHGQNQPCVEMEHGTPGRCYGTSQNHLCAVRGDTLPSNWKPWFINNNDGTVEGIRSTKGPFSAVQFNPEGCPGPRDAEFLFDRFIEQMRAHKKTHNGETWQRTK